MGRVKAFAMCVGVACHQSVCPLSILYLVQHAQRLTQRRDESISVIMYTFTCCIYKLLCSSVLDVVMSLMESRRANTYK